MGAVVPRLVVLGLFESSLSNSWGTSHKQYPFMASESASASRFLTDLISFLNFLILNYSVEVEAK